MGRGWTPGPGSEGRGAPSSVRSLPVWSRPPASSSAHPHLSVKSVTHLPASQGCVESQVRQRIGNAIFPYMITLVFHYTEARVLCRDTQTTSNLTV